MNATTGLPSRVGNTGYVPPRGADKYGNITPKGYYRGQTNQFTPQQHELHNSLYSQVGPDSYLARLLGGDQETFDQLEAPALKQFAALQGNLASRFSGMGLGGRKSSGFQHAANMQSSDFAQQLQANRLGLMNQARNDLFNMSNMLLGQRPYEQFMVKKDPSFLQKLLSGLGGGAMGAGLGYAAGGPSGALLGGSMGFSGGYGG